MTGPPIVLDLDSAAIVLRAIRSQTDFREFALGAGAVMADHVHVVVGVPGDPDPSDLLRILKAYASRALTAERGKPASGTWWTQSGSNRRLRGETHVQAAIEYVRRQSRPLALWAMDRDRQSG